MRNKTFLKQVTVIVLVLLLATPLSVMAQVVEVGTSQQTSTYVFNQAELDQMLAPIALYPDALLAQILSASTYPLEVVAAARFLKANQGLSAEVLLVAAQDKDWDPSVKALLEFPRILTMMDDQLEWTSKLGDAFLAQQADVMDSIQRLRQKAYAQGNLSTTQEQLVSVAPQTQVIIIESAAPNVVYVPVYDPAVVYGTWWYPDYPPYYYYLPRYVGAAFFAGIFIDLAWGWGTWGCNWNQRDVTINVTHYNDFTRNYYRGTEHYQRYSDNRGEQSWQHDPQHRQGIGYRDVSTAQRFGGVQRVEPTRTSRAPAPQVNNQVNARPLLSTNTIKFNTASRTDVTGSRKIDLRNNVPVQGNPGPTKNEPKTETRSQIITQPLNTTQSIRREQPSGVTIRQNTPNVQRNNADTNKTPRTTTANNNVQPAVKQSAGPIIRQNMPNIQRNEPGQAKIQAAPRTPAANNNVESVVTQAINNVRENVRAQINTQQLTAAPRRNTDNGNTQVTGIQNRVERAELSHPQPSVETALPLNTTPRSFGGFVHGPGR